MGQCLVPWWASCSLERSHLEPQNQSLKGSFKPLCDLSLANLPSVVPLLKVSCSFNHYKWWDFLVAQLLGTLPDQKTSKNSMSSVRKFPLMAELQTLFCFSSSSSFFCLGWGSKAIKLSTCLDLRLLTSNYITASNKYMMAAAALMFLKCQALLSSICNWFALAWTEVSQVWWMDLLREVLEHPVRFRNWTTFFQLLLGTSDPIATVACVCVWVM